MKANGSKELTFVRAKECKFGLMVPCMRGGCKTPKLTDLEDSFMLMATFTMVAGSMTKRTDKVSTVISTEPSMKEIGKKISNTVRDSRLGQMGLDMMGSTCLVKNME